MNKLRQTRTVLAPPGIREMCVIVALLFAGLVLATTRAAAQVGSGPATEAEPPSFDNWCLEIQNFAASRCDARRSDDVEAYEHYRALAEQFAQQRAAQDERDRRLKERLNREPGDVDPSGAERAGELR